MVICVREEGRPKPSDNALYVAVQHIEGGESPKGVARHGASVFYIETTKTKSAGSAGQAAEGYEERAVIKNFTINITSSIIKVCL